MSDSVAYEVHEGVNDVVIAVQSEDHDVVVSSDKPYVTNDPHIQRALDEHPKVKRVAKAETKREARAKAEEKT